MRAVTTAILVLAVGLFCPAERVTVGRPNCRVVAGGLDANWMAELGLPTVTLSAGQNSPHTVNEYLNVKDYLAGCRIALRLATAT